MSRARFLSSLATAAVVLVLGACRQATQIELSVSTTAACADVKGTTVSTGNLGEPLESELPATASDECTDEDHAIGSVVLVPSGASDAEVGLRVVTGIRTTADACAPPAYAGCIVARRLVRFSPHTSVRVHVTMDLSCLDVPCGTLQTCSRGSCVPATCEEGDTSPECLPGIAVADANVDIDATPDAAVVGTPCSTRDTCLPTEECSPTTLTCVPDTEGPRVLGAYELSPGVVRLELSEKVRDDAAQADRYCIREYSSDSNECLTSDPLVAAASLAESRRTIDLNVPGLVANHIYLVQAQGLTDASGQQVGAQSYASFVSGERFLRIVSASAVSLTRVELTFSHAPVVGTNGPGSAECEGAAECAKRYRILGASDLGDVTMVHPIADDAGNRLMLEHSQPQGGGAYTIVYANGRDGDGFDNAAFGTLAPLDSPAYGSGQNPIDRAVFFGLGEARILSFASGPLFVDPFGDGTGSGSVFAYRGMVYLGAGAGGRGAVRFRADGARPEVTSFFVRKDTTPPTQSSNTLDVAANGGFNLYLGAPGCFKNAAPSGAATPCGPDNEDGPVRFAAGVLGTQEWLFAAGTRSAGNLHYLYATSDEDAFLHFKYVDASGAAGGASKSASALGFFAGRVYAGLAEEASGPRPTLLTVQQEPTGEGLDPSVNGAGACLGTNAVCDLHANKLPRIGSNGSPPNVASPSAIDVLFPFASGSAPLLYLANSGGIVRSAPQSPVDITGWIDVTPSALAYTTKSGIVPQTALGALPSDRTWPALTSFHGRLYAARNTTTGPQLWACDPTRTGAPGDCEGSEWSLVAPNGSGDRQLTQLDRPSNQKLALLVASGSSLYVGYESTSGVALYRSAAEAPSAVADFLGEADCNAADPGCAPLAQTGLGSPPSTRIFDATSLIVGARSYMFVLTGTGSSPLRVYRSQD